jgi:hypothetical protein
LPDWLLTVPRLLWAPARWAGRQIRRRALDRQALVREGSTVLTPIISLTKQELGPQSILWGADEEHLARLKREHLTWNQMRSQLMRYANQHPSDRVRGLAHEVEIAVEVDFRDTVVLLQSRKSAATPDAYDASQNSHAEALEKTERLMTEIRRF